MVAVAAGRSVGNHGNEGDHFVFALQRAQADDCDDSAERQKREK